MRNEKHAQYIHNIAFWQENVRPWNKRRGKLTKIKTTSADRCQTVVNVAMLLRGEKSHE